jgi:hypothetical protein
MSTDKEQGDFPQMIQIRRAGLRAIRFLLHFLELQIAMGLGALICYLIVRLISVSSSFTVSYRPGTFLFATGDIFFLTVPVVAWMIFRGHGWRHSLKVAFAMILPVAVIMMLGQITTFDYLAWLLTAGYPAMSVGMLIYMLYHGDHFTRRIAYSEHTAVGIESSNQAS